MVFLKTGGRRSCGRNLVIAVPFYSSELLEVETELNTLTTLHRDRMDPEDPFFEDDEDDSTNRTAEQVRRVLCNG